MADPLGADGPIAGSFSPRRVAERSEEMARMAGPRPEGYDGTCLRPLGLCELGGSCDACWYSPDHPRFRVGGEG